MRQEAIEAIGAKLTAEWPGAVGLRGDQFGALALDALLDFLTEHSDELTKQAFPAVWAPADAPSSWLALNLEAQLGVLR